MCFTGRRYCIPVRFYHRDFVTVCKVISFLLLMQTRERASRKQDSAFDSNGESGYYIYLVGTDTYPYFPIPTHYSGGALVYLPGVPTLMYMDPYLFIL